MISSLQLYSRLATATHYGIIYASSLAIITHVTHTIQCAVNQLTRCLSSLPQSNYDYCGKAKGGHWMTDHYDICNGDKMMNKVGILFQPKAPRRLYIRSYAANDYYCTLDHKFASTSRRRALDDIHTS